MKEINFKRKTYGYHSSTMSISFQNGAHYDRGGITDPMMRSFRANICLRPSCTGCAFKSAIRKSDLTLFDCWHYTALTEKKDDDRGHTNVLIHSEKGMNIIQKCSKTLEITEVDAQKAIELDGVMVNNYVTEHPQRDRFMSCLSNDGLLCAIDECIPIKAVDILKESSKKFLYKMHLMECVKKLSKKNESR